MKESAGIIVKCKDKILICKRAKENEEPNKWAIPMGGVDPGEDIKDAAYREFVEEMGVDIEDDIRYLGLIHRYNKLGEVKSILHLYLYDNNVKIIPDLNNAKDGYEHSECGYYKKSDILNMNISQTLKEAILKQLSD